MSSIVFPKESPETKPPTFSFSSGGSDNNNIMLPKFDPPPREIRNLRAIIPLSARQTIGREKTGPNRVKNDIPCFRDGITRPKKIMSQKYPHMFRL
ncbi:MAG: hypothetical protein LBF41_01020 [Deltaproteobacteria bacterium]|jgi:hypothetical protein|nr:hypothetical protein [Deltaproteobacteria bacterium]